MTENRGRSGRAADILEFGNKSAKKFKNNSEKVLTNKNKCVIINNTEKQKNG